MSSAVYKVWLAGDQNEESSGWEILAFPPKKGGERHPWAMDAGDAAREWAKAKWADQDHSDHMECVVRAPDGTVSFWEITVETEPVFTPYQKGV